MRFKFYKTSKVLVFKTDVENNEKLNLIKPIFDSQHAIIEWSVDIQDVDKVLRLETNASINEHHIVDLMSNIGVSCIEMTW